MIPGSGKYKKYLIFYCLLFLSSAFFSTLYAAQLLRKGCRGDSVKEVQSFLRELEYLKVAPTGYFGNATAEAVKSFQMERGLKADGKVGSATYLALKEAVGSRDQVVKHTVTDGETLVAISQNYKTSVIAIMAKNNLPNSEVSVGQTLLIPVGKDYQAVASRSRTEQVQAVPWSIMEQLWRRGEIARVIDVETGESFQVKRFGGHYHSDTEPLTAQDTQIMRAIYGGHWSWDRRAVIIQIRNQYVAASMNGKPHGRKSIVSNGFSGHFCVHFLGSRIHKSGRIDPAHQLMVSKAAAASLPGERDRISEAGDAPEIRPAL